MPLQSLELQGLRLLPYKLQGLQSYLRVEHVLPEVDVLGV